MSHHKFLYGSNHFPPFGNQSLYDPEFPELKKFSIHNYFLAKSMRLLREGGIAAFVVSRYFMDAVDSSAREHIAGYADFLGAVRLPETAFRQNALTDVTTDIVFFQKHNGENKRSLEWLHTSSMEVDDLKHGGRRTAFGDEIVAQALRSTCWPMVSIKPLRSAASMKTTGATVPSFG